MEEDFELTLFDRIEVIKEVNKNYDLENNAYLSFSGGKDSTVLHYLLDIALPNNKIPRVYIDTGIEYNDIKQFVDELQKKDKRIIIIKPTQAIKPMLEKYGYPFKSKEHSNKVNQYKLGSRAKSIMKYKNGSGIFTCPNILKYQYEEDFKINISNKCCYKMKKEPIKKWQKENNKSIALLGLRLNEGGERANHKDCVVYDKDKNVVKFKPLNPISNEFEEWFIKKFNIKLCRLYYPPFNFKRTGCKGCPYALDLQEQLSIMQVYLPNERKQCELIWKPIYEEYRRINYRLDREEQLRLF